MMDLRLHARTHLTRVSEVIDYGTRLHRAIKEREPKDCCEARRMGSIKTEEGMELDDPSVKSKDLKWKFGHYVHNGTTWVREQVEHYPVIRNLIIKVDRSRYRSMGFVVPHNTHL